MVFWGLLGLLGLLNRTDFYSEDPVFLGCLWSFRKVLDPKRPLRPKTTVWKPGLILKFLLKLRGSARFGIFCGQLHRSENLSLMSTFIFSNTLVNIHNKLWSKRR